MSEDEPHFVVPFKEEPPLTGAPAWGQELAHRQARDRHDTRSEMTLMMDAFRREVKAINAKLGEEPESDGTGGRGLIGDVRKITRDFEGILALRNKGVGFVAAIVLCSAILIAGLIHMIQHVAGAGK